MPSRPFSDVLLAVVLLFPDLTIYFDDNERDVAWCFHVCLRALTPGLAAYPGTHSYNKFTEITARALRASLKEDKRIAAEKRGLTAVRYQKWENGQGGEQVRSQLTQR